MKNRIKIGVSACLLGKMVRYDGGHKAEPYLITTAGRYFSWIPVCPEREAGLGIPREPIRIVRTKKGALRLKCVSSGRDVTPQFERWMKSRLFDLAGKKIRGFILKARSPSCASFSAYVYGEEGQKEGRGDGFFTRALKKRFPHLPVIEEPDLYRSDRWFSFLDEVCTYDRFCREKEKGWKPGGLEKFHSAHRWLIMSHQPRILRALDKWASEMQGREEEYYSYLKVAFRYRPSITKHLNCLRAIAKKLKGRLNRSEEREVTSILNQFGKGEAPLEATLSILGQYVKKYGVRELFTDAYLFPPAWRRAIAKDPPREEKD